MNMSYSKATTQHVSNHTACHSERSTCHSERSTCHSERSEESVQQCNERELSQSIQVTFVHRRGDPRVALPPLCPGRCERFFSDPGTHSNHRPPIGDAVNRRHGSADIRANGRGCPPQSRRPI